MTRAMALAVTLAGCSSGGELDMSGKDESPETTDPFEAPEALPPNHLCVRWGSMEEGPCFDVSDVCVGRSPSSCPTGSGHGYYPFIRLADTAEPEGEDVLESYDVFVYAVAGNALPCTDCITLQSDLSIQSFLSLTLDSPPRVAKWNTLIVRNLDAPEDYFLLEEESAASGTVTRADATSVAVRGYATLVDQDNPRRLLNFELTLNVERTDDQ